MHAVCVHVGDPKMLRTLEPAAWDGGMADPPETCFFPHVLPHQIWSL